MVRDWAGALGSKYEHINFSKLDSTSISIYLYNKTGSEDDIIRRTLNFPPIARPWHIPAEFQFGLTAITCDGTVTVSRQ